ncbi:S8 family peptidase [Temperatibacter marinus]|uniref:S8 family peptidase n=1 Tax=Temperatibacter marinus TaxID=1456591 RepID=A0AA52HA05_9PROT|nr:S8 family peptidase [Temperatibacter marinus]WND02123.1 S8 family peptidase [Temperatibacter marinus]
MKHHKFHLLFSVAALTLLSACGGSGGGGSTTTPLPQPVIPTLPTVSADDYRTAEYNTNWALDAVNAAEAYASGYTGKGVKIGVVDFNFLLESDDINYANSSVGRQQQWVDIYEAQIGDEASTTPHGHSVAMVAAGVKDDQGVHGLAFDAEVIAVDFFSGVNLETSTANGVTTYTANPYRYAVEQGAKVVNKSLGYDEDDFITNPPVVSERFRNEVDAFVVLDGGLLVTSAGNNSDPEPSLSNLDTLNTLRENDLLDGPGAFIMVGAVDENNIITDFSDRAGTGDSQNHFMVAPGVRIVSYWDTETEGPGLYELRGTSFSAPLVSGAAALLWQRWPTLTAAEIRQILFDTATDLGEAGVDSIYGHGLLNVQNAVSAQGTAKIASISSPSGFSARNSVIQLPGSFGDGLALASALSSVTVFDKYNRDFQMDLAGGIYRSLSTPHLMSYLTQGEGWHTDNLKTPLGYLNFSYNFDQSLDAYMDRSGYFGEQQKNRVQEVSTVFEFSADSLPILGPGVSYRMGFGSSLSTVLDREGDVSNSESYIGRELIRKDNGAFNFSKDVYALVKKQISDHSFIQVGIAAGSIRETNSVSQSGHALSPLSGLSAINSAIHSAVFSYGYRRKKFRYAVDIGVVNELGSVLGGQSVGAFAFGEGSETVYGRLRYHQALGQTLAFQGALTLGLSQIKGLNQSLFSDFKDVTLSSWKMSLAKSDFIHSKDTLKLSLYQPLRVEKAMVDVTYGQGVDWAVSDSVLYSRVNLDLSPTGREVSSEITYQLSLLDFQFGLAMAYRVDAGHREGLKDLLSAVTIKYRF